MLVVSALIRTSRLMILSCQRMREDRTAGTHMELLQLLGVPAVQCPGLAPIEDRCANYGTANLELCGESDVVLVEYSQV